MERKMLVTKKGKEQIKLYREPENTSRKRKWKVLRKSE